MKLYISGKITGDKNYQKKFADAERRLVEAGYEAVNPAKLCEKAAGWYTAMRIAIKAMMDCGGVAQLDDWEKSKGAQYESKLGLDLMMSVYPIEFWIETNTEILNITEN
jgi:hypothetical protein